MKISKLVKSTKYLNRAAEVLSIATSKLIYPDRSVEMTDENKESKSQGDRVHFLNTGNSDCVLIQSTCHFALIDCGKPEYISNTISYIKKVCKDSEENIDIDFILFNTLTEDNLESLKNILNADKIKVNEIYINTLYSDNLKNEDKEADTVRSKAIEVSISKCVKVKTVLPQNEFDFGSLTVELLNTQPDNYHKDISRFDNSSAVLIKGNGRKVLVLSSLVNTTGDISRIANYCPKIDVLALAQNGKEKLNDECIKLFAPKSIIVQNSLENLDAQIIGNLMLNTSCNIYSAVDNSGIAVTFTMNELIFNKNIQ